MSKVRTIYLARRNCFVHRWQENGKSKERKSSATRRDIAEREAAALERELEDRLPPAAWSEFKVRYEAERLGSPYNFRAVCKRLEEAADIREVSDVTSDAISRMIGMMRQEGRPATTIKGYLKHLRAALGWAKEVGLIRDIPRIRMPKVAKRSLMRSRPVTGEEFDRMIAAAHELGRPALIPVMQAAYLGGLRRTELSILTADWTGKFAVMLDHDPPVFVVRGAQKSGKHEMIPIAPELVGYLQGLDLPKSGRLFRGVPKRPDSLGKAVARVGEAAGVVVNSDGKFATLHDLRRSFGTRWAKKLAPAELQVMMRHEDIKTTMDYYVEIQIGDLSSKLWQHSEQTKVAPFGGSINSKNAELPKNA